MSKKTKKISGHLVRTEDVTCSWDESVFNNITESNIDSETKTVNKVCLFGTRHSKNGYTYEDLAINSLTEKANEANFYINHPSKSEAKDRDGVRDIRHWGGVFKNATREGDKVYADLHVRESFWPLVYDVAMMKPKGIGNSINSRVRVYKDSTGKESILDIDTLKSVDLVSSAATTSNLFESVPEDAKETEATEAEEMGVDLEKEIRISSPLTEGILKDKIKEREMMRAVNQLQWDASDLIDNTLREKETKFADKKKIIGNILDELESEINNILTGKGIKKENINEEEDDMKYDEITIESIKKERPDLVEAIEGSIKDADKIKETKESVKTLTDENGKLKTEAITKDEEITTLKTENEDIKKKLDVYEVTEAKTKKQIFIADKVKELEIPDEAMTAYFKEDLLNKDEAGIEAALTDRKEAWAGKTGKVKGNGDEFDINESENKDKGKSKDKEEAAKTFVSTIKS